MERDELKKEIKEILIEIEEEKEIKKLEKQKKSFHLEMKRLKWLRLLLLPPIIAFLLFEIEIYKLGMFSTVEGQVFPFMFLLITFFAGIMLKVRELECKELEEKFKNLQ